MPKMTTIAISEQTKERLYKAAKGRETADQIVNRLLEFEERGRYYGQV